MLLNFQTTSVSIHNFLFLAYVIRITPCKESVQTVYVVMHWQMGYTIMHWTIGLRAISVSDA